MPSSQTPGEAPESTKEVKKMSRKQPQTPGEAPEPVADLTDEEQQAAAGELEQEQSGQASDDAAVEAGQQGRAHKIAKPRAPVAPANLGPRADTTRPQTANINAKAQISTDEAKAADRKGKLLRPVLTPDGWYVPINSPKERAARRKQGEPEYLDIE